MTSTGPIDGRLICALCKKATRSLYALPGERGAKLCADCFFSPLPTTSSDPLSEEGK